MAVEIVAAFEKRYAGTAIRAELTIPDDGFAVTVLFGPSGSGKTTVLRCLAGLERPESGYARRGAVTWSDAALGTFVAPQDRRVGYLFQDYALFPHLTVAQNVAYGLGALRPDARRRRVHELLRLVGLEGFDDRHPRGLSGGEQQRIALARAVAPHPTLLLLDEPLSALDAPGREQLRRDLRRFLKDLGIPALVVTHDRIEALTLGDRVVVMDRGRVCQAGPVHEVFSRPADLAVARIVGVETIHPATVVDLADGLAVLQVGRARLTAVAPDAPGDELYVGIRAEDVTLVKGATEHSSARNRLAGRIDGLVREGPLMRLHLECGFPLAALLTKQACEELELREGDEVTALVKAPAVHLIPRA